MSIVRVLVSSIAGIPGVRLSCPRPTGSHLLLTQCHWRAWRSAGLYEYPFGRKHQRRKPLSISVDRGSMHGSYDHGEHFVSATRGLQRRQLRQDRLLCIFGRVHGAHSILAERQPRGPNHRSWLRKWRTHRQDPECSGCGGFRVGRRL